MIEVEASGAAEAEDEGSVTHFHPERDYLYNHLDFDIEIFIKEQDGLLRPGLYDPHTEEIQYRLKANDNLPMWNIRLQEKVSLIIRFPELAEDATREFEGVAFYSDGLTPNGITLRYFDDGTYEYEFYFRKIDEYVGYLNHVDGHICEPGDPACDDQ